MGIPSYFSYIIKNYSNIIRNLYLLKCEGVAFQHLYMDCNSIIYDSVRSITIDYRLDKKEEYESTIIEVVIQRIDEYLQMIQATKTAFIAFDGVAPFAKMEQQRTRRYKNEFLMNYSSMGSENPEKWNTSNITPGTDFMQTLSKRISDFFNDPKNKSKYITQNIIISTSNEPGEGEHKMFHYMRGQTILPGENAAVYGLDSDLIMLSIFHCRLFDNLYIFREAPEFIKNKSIDISTQLPDDPMRTNPKEMVKVQCYFMDIPLLTRGILNEMGQTQINRAYDYIFMCFLLGNDFLPHFPSLNIRTHGIHLLIGIYKEYIGKYADRYFISLTDLSIEWKWVSLYINQLATIEHQNILSEYEMRKKWKNRNWENNRDSSKELDQDDFVFQSVPVIYTPEEDYICPTSPGWERRYYKSLLRGSNPTDVVKNYIEGLDWVFRYYTDDCPDWRWKYNYDYPPLLKDLSNYFSSNKIVIYYNKINTPVDPHVQLLYVLPRSAHNILPEKLRKDIEVDKKCNDMKNEYKWAFCRYFWEAHVILD